MSVWNNHTASNSDNISNSSVKIAAVTQNIKHTFNLKEDEFSSSLCRPGILLLIIEPFVNWKKHTNICEFNGGTTFQNSYFNTAKACLNTHLNLEWDLPVQKHMPVRVKSLLWEIWVITCIWIENGLTDLTTSSASPAEQQKGLSETLVFMLSEERNRITLSLVPHTITWPTV